MTTITITAVAIAYAIIVTIIALTILALPITATEVNPSELLVIRGNYRNPGVLEITMLPHSDFEQSFFLVDIKFKDWRHLTAQEIKDNGFQYLTPRNTLVDKLASPYRKSHLSPRAT
ncbi:uncharacterized protein B0J16DRAFT_379748 [Fusarium flagelliforme]|uniref:Uncharacterized protein n=1 Tax=Fusarium flagelliforme TaxID=2675880 RepID=A0A395MEJ6_9HYPO|nr:uncharacterized protein B0J16DRAFT_379748 [Fusarium flagelliforme]KAH7191860.1 hypothetical protein B0J16DRAFT_379748 [Fusarium flagelliforme]RFN45519.1 hypothetical protein FIE12Z_10282 [Fusarium flagelliforme]